MTAGQELRSRDRELGVRHNHASLADLRDLLHHAGQPEVGKKVQSYLKVRNTVTYIALPYQDLPHLTCRPLESLLSAEGSSNSGYFSVWLANRAEFSPKL